MSGNRVRKRERDEGLKNNGEFCGFGWHLPEHERNNVEKGEGNDACTESVDDPLQLFFDHEVGGLPSAVEDTSQSQGRKKRKMDEVQLF